MPALPFRNETWLMLKVRWLMLNAAVRWWAHSGTPSAARKPEGRRIADPDDVTSEKDGALSRASDKARLLRLRSAALRLDLAELARCEPLVLRNLERRCGLCLSRGTCVRDLAQDFARDPAEPLSRGWQDYCPNAAMLDMLTAVHGCSQPATKR